MGQGHGRGLWATDSAPVVGLGCEVLGGWDHGTVDIDLARDLTRDAWEKGITVFDTADVYGLGRGEEELSRALGSARHRAVIITKFGVRWKKGRGRATTWRDSTPRYLRTALEGSLTRLGVDRIPVYLVHWPDGRTPIEDTIDELMRQRDAGKIGVFGWSNLHTVHAGDLTLYQEIDAVQVPYNFLEQPARPVAKWAGELGIPVFAYSVLAQGLLSGKYSAADTFDTTDRRSRLQHFRPDHWPRNREALDQLSKVSAVTERPLAELAIRWVIEQPDVTVAVVGVRSTSQLNGLIRAAEPWPEDQLQLLSMAGAG